MVATAADDRVKMLQHCLAMVVAAMFAIPVAGVAADNNTSIQSESEVPDYMWKLGMMMSQTTWEEEYIYPVLPLTDTANSTRNINQYNAEGVMLMVDSANFNKISNQTIAYISCDSGSSASSTSSDSSGSSDSNLSPSDVMNDLANSAQPPAALVLYTLQKTYCSLTGLASLAGRKVQALPVYTMYDHGSAVEARNVLSGHQQAQVEVAIAGNNTQISIQASDNDDSPNNGTVAMSILYSITGLITLLFLGIIVTGAVRAHRNPERYGPRDGSLGMPRQSRARGLARAVLETIPIVKFGDPPPPPTKRGPEQELESVADEHDRVATPAATAAMTPADAAASITTATTATTATPAIPRGSTSIAMDQPNPATDKEAVVGTTPDNPDALTAIATTAAAATGTPEQAEHPACSICTEDFAVGENVRVLPCDHQFHPQCVDPWLIHVSGTCPLCRLDLSTRKPSEGDAEVSSLPNPEQYGAGNEQVNPSEAGSSQRQRRSRRQSRFFDWNQLQNAPLNERVWALRMYRAQHSEPNVGGAAASEDQNRRHSLAERFRDRFHIRTRTPRSNPDTTEPAATNPPSSAAGGLQ